MQTKKQETNTSDSLTYLMLPFYFSAISENENLIDELTRSDTMWQRSIDSNGNPTTIEKGILYEYINPNTDVSASPFLVFSLKTPDKGTDEHIKTSINKVWNKLEASFQTKEGKKFDIEFKRAAKSWDSVRLLVAPRTHEGILVMGVGIKNNESISAEDIIDFSYHICKIDGQQKLLLTGYSPDDNTADLSALSEIDRKKREARIASHNTILEALIPDVINPKSKDKKTFLEESKATGLFKLTDIINFLMQNLPDWKLFNTQRMHVFNYFSIQKTDKLLLSEADKRNIILFTRCENNKYKVLPDEFETSGAYLSTFANVYMGCSSEGTCIYTIRDNSESDPFIKQFALSQLQHRYLWLYCLALMQRHSLLRMVDRITRIELDNQGNAEFNKNFGSLCKTKIHGYFINISPYAHHNKYYKFCLENLDVCRLYNEVEDKMKTIDSYLQMRNNELLEERKEQERMTLEMKEAEKREREEQQERIANVALWVSIFAAILAYPQSAQALKDLFNLGLLTSTVITLTVIVLFIISIWYIWKRKK